MSDVGNVARTSGVTTLAALSQVLRGKSAVTLLGAVAASLLCWLWRKRPRTLLDKVRKTLKIIEIENLSADTKRFRLSLGSGNVTLGLPIGKHVSIYASNPAKCISAGTWNGRPDEDKGKSEIERKYTPVTGDEVQGYVDLVIKIYRPGVVRMPDGREMKWEDGGKLGLFLDGKQPGDTLEVNGPFGVNEYLGRGKFKLPGRVLTVKHVGMLAGGTGITPMLQVAQAALRDPSDLTTFSLIYANKTEGDILCRDLLEEAMRSSNGRFRVHYTLDFPPKNWSHKTGFITAEMIKECLPGPSDSTMILMCGPPPMIEHACKKNLDALGYDKKYTANF